MGTTEEKQKNEDLEERIRSEIIPIFEKAIADDTVIFYNRHLQRCWETKYCNRSSCPIFNKDNQRCWQIAGTYCGGAIQGGFVDKYSSCSACEVFRNACPTIVEELGEHLNNMLFLLRKQKFRVLEDIRKIEYLNYELSASLESLDARKREIQEMVITDKLSGLYNRNYLFTVIEDEVAHSARGNYTFSLMMIDIDNFKSYNDNYGHLEGDKVLAAMGQILRDALRKTDRAFRYGGEEFLVVLPDTDMTIAYLIAERVRRSFRELRFIVESNRDRPESIPLTLTVSIGIAGYSKGLDMYSIVSRADEAMYRAKSMGKDMTFRFREAEEKK